MEHVKLVLGTMTFGESVFLPDAEGFVNAVRPVRELRAFKKVALEPGESKEVSFTLGKRAFATWRSEIHDWWVETGDFTIEVGDSVANLPLKATVKVESTVQLPRHFDMDSIVMDMMADPKAKAVPDAERGGALRRRRRRRSIHRSHLRRDEHGHDAVYARAHHARLQ